MEEKFYNLRKGRLSKQNTNPEVNNITDYVKIDFFSA